MCASLTAKSFNPLNTSVFYPISFRWLNTFRVPPSQQFRERLEHEHEHEHDYQHEHEHNHKVLVQLSSRIRSISKYEHVVPSSSTIFILAAYEIEDFSLTPGFELTLQYQNQQTLSPLYSASTASDLTLVGDQQYSPYSNPTEESNPRPRKKIKAFAQEASSQPGARISSRFNPQMTTNAAGGSSVAADASAVAAANKPKRVRTGCLTCRERHLKCDEGLPHCQNCRKSNRVCKRGVRLNFIDTQVQSPPIIPPTADWAGT